MGKIKWRAYREGLAHYVEGTYVVPGCDIRWYARVDISLYSDAPLAVVVEALQASLDKLREETKDAEASKNKYAQLQEEAARGTGRAMSAVSETH